MIRFHCHRCGQQIAVSDELAGRHGKCSRCGTVNTVPGERARPPGTPPRPGGAAGGSEGAAKRPAPSPPDTNGPISDGAWVRAAARIVARDVGRFLLRALRLCGRQIGIGWRALAAKARRYVERRSAARAQEPPEQPPEHVPPPPASHAAQPPAGPPAGAGVPGRPVSPSADRVRAPADRVRAPAVDPPVRGPVPAPRRDREPEPGGPAHAAAWGRWVWRYVRGFLSFRIQITQHVMAAVWVLGSVAIILAAVHRASVEGGSADAQGGSDPVWDVLAVLASLVAWRLFCEALVLPFPICNSLGDMARSLGMQPGRAGAPKRDPARAVLDVLLIRSLIFVFLVQVGWVVGSVWIALGAEPDALFRWLTDHPALQTLCRVAGVFVWRLVCEVAVAWYRASETLSELRRGEGFSAAKWSVGGFLTLRCMLVPWLVRIVWFAGLAGLGYVAITGPSAMPKGIPAGWAIVVLPLGVLVLRMACESAIVLFTLHEGAHALEQHASRTLPGSWGAGLALPPGPRWFRRMITPGLIVFSWILGLPILAVWLAVASPLAGMLLHPLVVFVGTLGILAAHRATHEVQVIFFRVNEAFGRTAVAVGAGSGVEPSRASCRLGDILMFRAMLLPILIQIAWLVAVILYIVGLIAVLTSCLPEHADWILTLVILMTVVLMGVRVYCEYAIVLFSINKILAWLRRGLDRALELAGRGVPAGGAGQPDRGVSRTSAGVAAFGCILAAVVLLCTLGTGGKLLGPVFGTWDPNAIFDANELLDANKLPDANGLPGRSLFEDVFKKLDGLRDLWGGREAVPDGREKGDADGSKNGLDPNEHRIDPNGREGDRRRKPRIEEMFTWLTPGWQEGGASARQKLVGTNCRFLRTRQIRRRPVFGGLSIGPKATDTGQSDYTTWRDGVRRQFAAVAAGLAGGNRKLQHKSEKIDGVAYDRSTAFMRDGQLTVLTAVRHGRCMAFWYVGTSALDGWGSFTSCLGGVKRKPSAVPP